MFYHVYRLERYLSDSYNFCCNDIVYLFFILKLLKGGVAATEVVVSSEAKWKMETVGVGLDLDVERRCRH